MSPRGPAGITSGAPFQRLSNALERRVEHGVITPTAEIKVPPFRGVHGEAVGLHVPAEQVAPGALEIGAARVRGVRARTEFVITAGHAHRTTSLQVVQGQVNSRSPVMA